MFSNFPTSSTNCEPSNYEIPFFHCKHGKIKCLAATLSLLPTCFGRDKRRFFTRTTLQSAVKIYSNLMEWAVRRSAGTLHRLEKSRGPGPVAFSTVCLWQLLSQGTGPDTAVRHSCPLSLWTVASHTTTAASCPRRPAVAVVEVAFLSWKRQGDHCPDLSSPPSNTFHYGWMKNNPFKTIFTLAVIIFYRRSHKAIKVSLLQSLLESVVSHHIIKS